MTNQTADPFMESGSAPGIKFPEVGDVRTITVRKSEKKIDVDMATNTPKTWPNGDPMHVFVFTGEDEAGEPASLWVRGHMVTAMREAVATAGVDTVVNTKVTVKFDSLGTPSQRGFSPPKLFKAKVEKVAAPVAASGAPVYPDEEPF